MSFRDAQRELYLEAPNAEEGSERAMGKPVESKTVESSRMAASPTGTPSTSGSRAVALSALMDCSAMAGVSPSEAINW